MKNVTNFEKAKKNRLNTVNEKIYVERKQIVQNLLELLHGLVRKQWQLQAEEMEHVITMDEEISHLFTFILFYADVESFENMSEEKRKIIEDKFYGLVLNWVANHEVNEEIGGVLYGIFFEIVPLSRPK